MTADLERELRDLRDALDAFTRNLEAEAQALEHLRADDLAPLVEKKHQLSLVVAAKWARINDLSRNNPRLREEIDKGGSTFPGRDELWREIRRLGKRAGQVNASNGQLIEAQLRRTRFALDILQQASNRQGVYGADGQMLDLLGGGSRTLDKA
jgi:flagellar biosynthesis/type III secretory pathway chaperone